MFPIGAALPGVSIPRIPTQINFDYFLDRESVIAYLGKRKAQSLKRSGYRVMTVTRRSIRRMGAARPRLKVMRQNPGVRITDLLARQGISNYQRRKLEERWFEVQFKPASQPGTPPHTHTPVGEGSKRDGMFRKFITFAWDQSTESVVVGQAMPGGAWLAGLHEFGGRQTMHAWAWVAPFRGGAGQGILSYYLPGRGPRRRDRWQLTGFTETFDYPARPYMEPAAVRCARDGTIRNQFRVSR
jgi:hypothetical protein